MRARSSLAVFRHNVRLLLGDPGPIVIFILTPLLVMAILKPTQEVLLQAEGFSNANGSEQVVPGFTVMFVFFWLTFVGRNFFQEHGWGTWERLQVSPAGQVQVLIGKLLPAFVVIAVQILILFVAGALIFDMDSAGPILALLVVGVPLVACVLALTLALFSLARTLAQHEAASNLLMIVYAALGGALTPVSVLPDAAQEVAPATPSYWALEACREVILEGEGLSAMWAPAGALTLFTLSFAVVAFAAFRFTESKAIEI
jgi:ABC-2 type transport system permease protein